MLKKPLRRVKRRKGAVLFAVISIMALLIAMASTAYFTAKSAYNSVISNYSYSQLYLSTISVSDMVLDAIMNDSAASATSSDGSDATLNYYKSLRDSILELTAAGDVRYAYSANISNPAATEADIVDELRDANATIPGVVDGIVVKIELLDSTWTGSDYIDPTGTSTDYQWRRFANTYRFTTTAYYRNNMIAVEDIFGARVSRLWNPNDGTDGSPFKKGDYIPGSGGLGSPFNTFFTATGQKLEDGKIVRTTRTVKIKTHEISDDAFFQNTSTYFVNGNNNDFVGGVTSTGSIYLEKFTTNISGANNDWWIGDDLVMTNNNANNLNITKDNSIYVADDLVIAANGNITAKDVYVEGDLYIMGQANFNCNLHVSGNIYYEMGDTFEDENGEETVSPSATAAADGVYLGSTKWDQYTNGWSVSGDLEINGNVYVPDGYTNDAKINVNGQQVTIPTGTAASTDTNNIGTYDPSSVNINYVNRLPNYETDEFEDVESSSTVSSALDSQVGTNTEYANITAPSETYNKEVKIDFDLLAAGAVADDTGKILYYEYSDPDTGLYIVSETADLNGNVSVTIPYNEDGYVLDIDAESIESSLGCNVNITYNIETSDDPDADAMPIVLKNNILVDSDGDGEEDDPGFSWQGNNYGSNDNSSGTIIQTIGDGNVVLEMANLDKDGKPVPYDPNKDGDYTVVTYVAGQKEVVGTEDQCAVIGAGGNLTQDKVNSMLQDGTSTPLEQYNNRIMLVSNKNDGVAVDAARQNNAFCGYIYSPNGELDNYAANGETAPIFGGMIVSTYNAELSKLYYAEPKPSVISHLISGLDFWSPDSSAGSYTPDIPATEGEEPDGDGVYVTSNNSVTGDKTSFADTWAFGGSNFVG